LIFQTIVSRKVTANDGKRFSCKKKYTFKCHLPSFVFHRTYFGFLFELIFLYFWIVLYTNIKNKILKIKKLF
jgi:hypothetical protein